MANISGRWLLWSLIIHEMTGHTWLGIWVSLSEVLRDNIFKLCWTQATVQADLIMAQTLGMVVSSV